MLYLPKHPARHYYSHDEEDDKVAEAFRVLEVLVDESGCADDFVLWLSTCRNYFMTINALFVDVRAVIGHGKMYSTLSAALHFISNLQDLDIASKFLNECGLALSEIKRKQACWEKRHEFRQILDDLLKKRNHYDEQLLTRILFKPRAAQTDQSAWPLQYTEVNYSEPAHLHHYRISLNEAAAKLTRIVDIGRKLLVALDACENLSSEQHTPQLIPESNNRTVSEMWQDLIDYNRANLNRESDISLRYNNACLEVRSADAVWEPLLEHETDLVLSIQNQVKNIASALYRDVETVHDDLCKRFKPNIGSPPLPRVFKVDLRACSELPGCK